MKTLLLLLACLQAPIFPVTAKEEKPEPVKESGTYLVVFTASWCGPCQQWKQNERPKLNGVTITTVDIDKEKQWGVGTVPSFWIVDRETRKPVKKLTGYTSADTLLKTLSPDPAKPQGVPVLFGRVGTSHESRQTLINHLLNDSIHKGRHTLAELESMTDQQLSDLHDREHNQATGSASTTRWTIQPQRVQTVKRRRGLFFQW